ncbi:MAG TPA: LemA family protein [Gaiellaceae bacterium]|nr:LemA family protein [Gaiellaceae bacterium]
MVVVIVVVVVAVVLLLVLAFAFNHLVRLRNETQAGWANIDVQLKRRNDLIPNLVEAVKGYAAHERGLFDEITQARAAVQGGGGPAATAAASDQLSQGVGRLFAVAENYPQLRATENFQQLQSELTDTEDKIAAARRYYNSVVQTYNTAIQSFPAVLYAGMLGFKAREFFAAQDSERATPQVSTTTT